MHQHGTQNTQYAPLFISTERATIFFGFMPVGCHGAYTVLYYSSGDGDLAHECHLLRFAYCAQLVPFSKKFTRTAL
jgi:hypothetical protein